MRSFSKRYRRKLFNGERSTQGTIRRQKPTRLAISITAISVASLFENYEDLFNRSAWHGALP